MTTSPFPPGFFDRDDDADDVDFYRAPRFVTHIDPGAIAAVGALYAELGVDGSSPGPVRVLDLMSSWISHLRAAPAELVVLGLNEAELAANPMATERVLQDLNTDPALPFPDASLDAVLCCVSIDYLVHPVEVLAEAARVLRPGAPVVLTFSNRCFPTKAVHGWLATDDDGRCAIVAEYLRAATGFTEPEAALRTPPGRDRGGRYSGDPLYSVVARRLGGGCTCGSGRRGMLDGAARAAAEKEAVVLVAFSVSPSGDGRADGSVHDAVAAAVRIVRESGLPNRTDSMFTTVEGEWDEVFDVVKRATEAVGAFGSRVSLVLKADIRPGWTGEMTGKLDRLEQALDGGAPA